MLHAKLPSPGGWLVKDLMKRCVSALSGVGEWLFLLGLMKGGELVGSKFISLIRNSLN